VVEHIQLSALRTPVTDVGKGPTVVWLSGGGGRATDWEEHYTTPFADAYRSIAFDNRGTAGTTCTEPTPWSVRDMADDAAELLAKLCDAPAVVVGHSLGALIMLQLVVDRPDLVELGISLAGSARADEGWVGDYMRAEIALRRAGVRLSPAFSAAHYAAMMYPAKALQDRTLWAALREALESPDVAENTEDTVLTQWEPCLTFNVTEQLPSTTVPLEVVCFSEDVCSPPAYSAELAELAPGARYHELAGMGHGSLFGHRPDDVSRLVRRLVDEHFSTR
jgi:pimeloyl-ACP methyl ester carboxylesterase